MSDLYTLMTQDYTPLTVRGRILLGQQESLIDHIPGMYLDSLRRVRVRASHQIERRATYSLLLSHAVNLRGEHTRDGYYCVLTLASATELPDREADEWMRVACREKHERLQDDIAQVAAETERRNEEERARLRALALTAAPLSTMVPPSSTGMARRFRDYTGYELADYLAVTNYGFATGSDTATGVLNVFADPTCANTELASAIQAVVAAMKDRPSQETLREAAKAQEASREPVNYRTRVITRRRR